jgi:hypothetical protein
MDSGKFRDIDPSDQSVFEYHARPAHVCRMPDKVVSLWPTKGSFNAASLENGDLVTWGTLSGSSI